MSATIKGWKDINPSEDGEAFLLGLEFGECGILFVKHIDDKTMPKLQIEFAEKLERQDTIELAITSFNESDKRFGPKARRTWVSIGHLEAKALFGLELPDDEAFKEVLDLIKPREADGKVYRIMVVECTEGELPNSHIDRKELHIKKRGADGPVYFTESGETIYQYTQLAVLEVGQEVPHIRLEGVAKDPKTVGNMIQQTPGVSKEIQNTTK